jgi:hypothetical protein
MDDKSVKTMFENIQKIFLLSSNGEPEQLLIFNSNETVDSTSPIFFDEEKTYLEKYKPVIIQCTNDLHQDDTIRTIKRKILNELNYNNLSYEEMYLFSKKTIHFQLKNLFNDESSFKNGIHKQHLGQILMNLQLTHKKKEISELFNLDKQYYSYKDIEDALQINNTQLEIDIPIGHKFATFQDFAFSANPFNILPNVKTVFDLTLENTLFTFENNLLLNYGDLKNNTLYLCRSENVFTYIQENQLNEKKNSALYFPFLNSKDIHSLTELKVQKQDLIDKSKKKFDKISDDQINLLYSIHKKETNVHYASKGIVDAMITIHPSNKLVIPLENIFKKMNSDASIPLIKFKPGFKKEELYRLYTIGISNNGKKIPFLSRLQINTYMKRMSGISLKHVSYIMEKKLDNHTLHILCSITHTGNIIIDMSFPTPVSKFILETYLLETANHFIKTINQSLLSMNHYVHLQSLEDNCIEYNKINYEISIQSNSFIKNADFNMFTNVFNIVGVNNNTGNLRYKKVDNYTEMNEMNALINKLYKQNSNIDNIVGLISINFSLHEEEARMHITKYLNEYTLVNGNYINKEVEVADNPGFATIVQYNDILNTIHFSINDIDSIYYIDQIDIYVDALIKSSLYAKQLKIPVKDLDTLKKKLTKTKIDIDTDNVVSVEDVHLQNYKPNVRGIIEDMKDEDDEYEEGIFFDDEEEDDEEENEDEENEDEDDEEEGEDEENEDEDEENEDEDEEEDEEEDIDLFKGGNEKTTGTLFYNKLKKLEPNLFKNENDIDYARVCPAISNRQPVILTEEEKRIIDEDPQSKSAFGIAIKYGTDPEKPYWYMCPRYWCLKTNKPMTDEQVKNGECGGKIIPKNKRSNIPTGYYIYEFTDDRQHIDANGNYTYYNPGFLGKSKNNIGVPCCFRNPFSVQQNTRRQELNITDAQIDYGNENLINGVKTDKTKVNRNYLNILSIERVPVPPHRWGFLPLSVELFLNTDNSLSLEKSNPTYISKEGTPLLRYGVEKSTKQSFIACLADIYTYHNNMKVPSIKEMRSIIVNNISIDVFIKANNGNLISLFRPTRVNINDIEVEKYRTTKFYNSIDLNNSSQNNFLKYTIASFNKFREFMNDDDSLIDHTILWDIISSKENKLFERGLNLLIMEIEDNDIRDNISLICPTNSYMDIFFDSEKGSVLLLKHGEFYEPIYVYGNTRNENASNKLNAIKILYNENIPPYLTSTMENIKNSLNHFCKPENKNKGYKYKTNISAEKSRKIMESFDIYLHRQVQNYDGKIIGLMVSEIMESDNQIYIPTYPSSKLDNVESIFIDNVIWSDYNTTVQNLQTIYNKTDNLIFSQPLVKIEEDGLIIGILTQTNQLVVIDPPVPNLESDDIKTIKSSSYKHYYDIDKSIMSNNLVDAGRLETIHNIKLETAFYKQFRDILRNNIHDMMNNEYARQLESLSNSTEYVYSVKMMKIKELIEILIGANINFVEFDEDVLRMLNNNNNNENHNNHSACIVNEHQLCVPSKNLITQEDNRDVYYQRLSDEIIRFNRIKQYLFNSLYTKLENINYHIHSNEVLLLSSNLSNDYFDNISYDTDNKYIENIPSDFSNPTDKPDTTKRISLMQQTTVETVESFESFHKECILKSTKLNMKQNWNNIFSEKHTMNEIKHTPLCSYYILAYLLKKYNNIEENLMQIKQRLTNAYETILKNYLLMPSIHVILAKQFKKDFIVKIRKHQLNIETMIMNDNYNITQFDIWIFCNYMNIPAILYSNKIYTSMKLNTNYIVMGGDMEKDEYTFIRSDQYKQSDEFSTPVSIVEPPMLLKDTKDIVLVKESLTDYLKNYKLTGNLRIKK